MKNKRIIRKIWNLINIPLYDDLTPYLTGVRDMLNAVYGVSYIFPDELLEHIKNEIYSLKMVIHRIDVVEEDNEEIVENYDTINEVIEDANRFYHEHFKHDDNYKEYFELKTLKEAEDFWLVNGFEIIIK